MEIKELIKNKKIADPIKKFTTEILAVYKGEKKNDLLTIETAKLGLLFLNALPDFPKEKTKYGYGTNEIIKFGKRHNAINELIPNGDWKSKELKNLLVFFFGEEKAEYVSYAWEKIRFQMYQTGYSRRSFRSPENRELYSYVQANFITAVISQISSYEYNPNYTQTFYDLNVVEQLRFSNYLATNGLFRVWSAAIDLGNTEILKQAEDIIFNKDEIGKVSRDLIKALLNSDKKEGWELVGKLLLAAQRQEGLRQTILESLDETSIGALKYMINIIIDNKLTRFSSVVRSVDVWAGLGWESERETTVRNFLEKAKEYLENPEEVPKAVKSANNMDVYMALWSQGVYDLEKTATLLADLFEKGNNEKRSLALKFALEAQHPNLDLPLFYKALGDPDLMVLAWALRGLNSLFINIPTNSVISQSFRICLISFTRLCRKLRQKRRILAERFSLGRI